MANAKRILVIDDDEDLVLSTTALLRARGWEAEGARNSVDGLAKIRDWQPDLLVLDIMMDNDTEGFQLAYKLKEDPTLRGLPVIIVSSFQEHLADKMDKFQFVLGNEWPAEAMLEKPVKPEKLAETVASLLAAADARAAAAAAE
jgi:CheY-like chemotaxis protein